MTFLAGKYYVCVGDYILDETQSKQKERNQFIEIMKAVEYNDRMRSRSGMSITRPSSSWHDYEYFDHYGDCVIVPKFTIGKIYKCYFGGRLIDDNRNVIQISDDNIENFVYLNFNIDEVTNAFIQKGLFARGGGIRIVVEPSHLMNFDLDAYRTLQDISKFELWFTVSASGFGFNYSSITMLEDDLSIRNAVYNIWKKCRIHSKQCNEISFVLHHSHRVFIHSFDSYYNNGDRWLI
jgi:hypothetical protein